MRVRKMKRGDERFAAVSSLAIPFDKENPEMLDLCALFPGFTRFRMEIGCGKGGFIAEEARRHPDVAFLAVEKIRDVLIFAMEKTAAEELPNVRFLCADAEYLPRLVPENRFERLYINFCDPWPKARHEKRRLTYRGFLGKFRPLLSDDGFLAFKTDNRALFDFSLGEFPEAGFELRAVTFDLHHSEWNEGNIMTEYEKNFSEKGFPIHRLEAVPVRK